MTICFPTSVGGWMRLLKIGFDDYNKSKKQKQKQVVLPCNDSFHLSAFTFIRHNNIFESISFYIFTNMISPSISSSANH